MTYSSAEEDEILQVHFGDRIGRFLDLGGGDGKTISNTYALLHKGWAGVYVEASWRPVEAWRRNTAFAKGRAWLVHAAVTALQRAAIAFWDHPTSEISTCCDRLQARPGREQATQMFVGALTPRQILEAFPGAFEVVSIDVEGWSVDVMQAVPFDEIATEAIVVEVFPKQIIGTDDDAIVREWAKANGWSYRKTLENAVLTRNL